MIMRKFVPRTVLLVVFALCLAASSSVHAQTKIMFDSFEGKFNPGGILGASVTNRVNPTVNWLLIDPNDVENPNPFPAWDIAGVLRLDSKGNRVYFGGEAPRTGTNAVYCARWGFENTSNAPAYPSLQRSWLTRTNLDLRGYANATLSFWYKFKVPDTDEIFALYQDFLSVYIDDDAIPVFDTSGLEEKVTEWTKVTIPINEYVGEVRSLSFEFFSDISNDTTDDLFPYEPEFQTLEEYREVTNGMRIVKVADYEGAYIDDVLVTGTKTLFQPDHNQDQAIDLIFQHTDNRIATWYMNETNFLGSIMARDGKASAPGYRLLGYNDFDTNGCVDFFFQHTNTGQLMIWYMSHSYITNATAVTTNSIVLETNSVTVTNDVIVTNRIVTGGTNVITTNRTVTIVNYTGTTNLTAVSNVVSSLTNYYLTNTAVFRGTNTVMTTNLFVTTNHIRADTNFTTSTNIVRVRTVTIKTPSYVPISAVRIIPSLRPEFVGAKVLSKRIAAGWTLASVADIDSDGGRDFVFQNGDGRVAWWRMNGTNWISTALIVTNMPSGTPAAKLLPANYRVAGAADFNGDGENDLVLQSTVNNSLIMWFMIRGAVKETKGIGGTIFQGWRVCQLTDFQGDGQVDFVAQHLDGRVAIWYVNTAGNITLRSLARGGKAIQPGWKLMGPH